MDRARATREAVGSPRHPLTKEEKLDEFKRFLEDVDPEDFQG